jgi:diguanylate cyclase (GGDEF)-like protein
MNSEPAPANDSPRSATDAPVLRARLVCGAESPPWEAQFRAVLGAESTLSVGPIREESRATDLVIVDASTGGDALARLLEVQREFPTDAVIGVVRADRESDGDALLRFGAHAVLGVDECGPRGILRAVRYALLRRDAELEIERLRLEDPLTGLPNVHSFRRSTLRAIQHSGHGRRGFALAVLDIDDFRELNHRLGRQAGDELLREIAARAVDASEGEPHVARRGDDQFLLRIDDVDEPSEALRRVTDVMAAASRGWRFGEHELKPSITAGIALYPGDAEQVDRLLEVADDALRRAKRTSPGQALLAGHRGADRTHDERTLVDALREALAQEQFVLHYQPQFDLGTNELAGVEAFLRWARPGHGLVHAAHFVRALETSGGMVDVERWVFHTACRQLRAWRELTGRRFRMAVNVSARHFLDPDLPRTVDQALRASGLPTGALELEITERVAMHDVHASLARIEELDAVGATVAIDDFGTGSSSLRYLRRFAIDAVKIDHTFVSDLAQGRDGEHVTRGIVALARALDLRVVAEGVESSEQIEQLRVIGCSEAQGHFLGAPEPAFQLEAKLVHELAAGWGGIRRQDPTGDGSST